jgi:hypothetical protein
MEFYLHSTYSTRRILIYIFVCIEELGGGGEFVEVNITVLMRTNREMEGEQDYETSCILNHMNLDFFV